MGAFTTATVVFATTNALKTRPRLDEEPVVAAGSSARREYERRRARHEQRTRDRHPILGGLLLSVRDEPSHVHAWAKGAAGEEAVGRRLDGVASPSLQVLHDRRIPGRRANIDHIVIGPAGLFVVDTKYVRGRVESRGRRADVHLWVGGRDRNQMVHGMERQVEAVRRAVDQPVPIVAVLCFVRAEWPLLTRSFVVDEVVVCPPRELVRRVREAGPFGTEVIDAIAGQVKRRLPAA